MMREWSYGLTSRYRFNRRLFGLLHSFSVNFFSDACCSDFSLMDYGKEWHVWWLGSNGTAKNYNIAFWLRAFYFLIGMKHKHRWDGLRWQSIDWHLFSVIINEHAQTHITLGTKLFSRCFRVCSCERSCLGFFHKIVCFFIIFVVSIPGEAHRRKHTIRRVFYR